MAEPKHQHPEIAEAIKFAGSQMKLAELCGCAQQTISKMLNREVAVTAELAKRIDGVTSGAVPCWKLRPDLWDAPVDTVAA